MKVLLAVRSEQKIFATIFICLRRKQEVWRFKQLIHVYTCHSQRFKTLAPLKFPKSNTKCSNVVTQYTTDSFNIMLLWRRKDVWDFNRMIHMHRFHIQCFKTFIALNFPNRILSAPLCGTHYATASVNFYTSVEETRSLTVPPNGTRV